MRLRNATVRVVEAVVLVAILGLLLGVLLGQPVMFGFVETESMSPALEANDGFVAIPNSITGDVSEGDVIVFEARDLHGGGMTTHRVVEETDDGYITQGDANPFTDQDGNEPPVQDEQIVAKALQVNGTVVPIPSLGYLVGFVQSAMMAVAIRFDLDAFQGPQSLLLAVFVTCMLAYAYLRAKDERGGSSPARMPRDVSRPTGVNAHHVVIVVTVCVILLATVSMVYPGGSHQITVESAEADQPGLHPGETETDTVHVPNSGYLPQVAVFDGGGTVAAEPSNQYLESRSVGTIEVTATAPSEPGTAETHTLSEHRYWAVLPPSLVTSLHGVHPLVALGAINAVIATPFYVFGRVLLGTGRIRLRTSRPDDGSPSATSRLRRYIRNLY